MLAHVHADPVDFPKTAVESTETLMNEANKHIQDKIDDYMPEDEKKEINVALSEAAKAINQSPMS